MADLIKTWRWYHHDCLNYDPKFYGKAKFSSYAFKWRRACTVDFIGTCVDSGKICDTLTEQNKTNKICE